MKETAENLKPVAVARNVAGKVRDRETLASLPVTRKSDLAGLQAAEIRRDARHIEGR